MLDGRASQIALWRLGWECDAHGFFDKRGIVWTHVLVTRFSERSFVDIMLSGDSYLMQNVVRTGSSIWSCGLTVPTLP